MAKHQKSWNTNHVGRSQSVRAKHPQTHREGETATGWGVSETPVETSLLAWSFPTHLPHLRGLDTLSMTTAHHSVILPRSVWAAGGGPISLDVGGDNSARLPKNRHGYPLGGSQLLQTGWGGGVWTADEHPHRGWSGSGGRQETTGQRDRFAWKSHGGREVQRELPLIRLGQWATHLTVIQIAKEPLTLCGKLYLMFKTEMLFPQRPWNVKNALLWIPGAPGGNELCHFRALWMPSMSWYSHWLNRHQWLWSPRTVRTAMQCMKALHSMPGTERKGKRQSWSSENPRT